MLTIYKLSLTQMLRPKRLLILLFIASIPVALSVVTAIFPPDTEDLVSFRDNFLMGPMVISAVLPIVTVVLGTASLGHEIEDQTMTYLFLKPVSRWGIILPKFLATITVAGVVVIGSGVLTTVIVPEGSLTTSVAAAVGLAVGVLAYTSIFTWAGLMTSHALAVGLVYVFVWEAAIVGFLQGVRWLSIRHYTEATIHGFDDIQFAGDTATLTLPQALAAAGIVVALFLTLTLRRLARMDVA
ncbi:MAG TPA: ABC transporter permease [Dehalococcoidia bacterium]|jgi:ABC-2 type transport system permease protein|nr:ABC transporter permease [Dehalococcoidia bacterium]